MSINYVFAGLVVSNRDEAAAWYERLFGKPPEFLPNESEAVWQVANTASVYLLADAQRAGRSIMALNVDDLEARLEDIRKRGIECDPPDEIPGSGLKCVIRDPDGNEISLLQIFANQ